MLLIKDNTNKYCVFDFDKKLQGEWCNETVNALQQKLRPNRRLFEVYNTLELYMKWVNSYYDETRRTRTVVAEFDSVENLRKERPELFI